MSIQADSHASYPRWLGFLYKCSNFVFRRDTSYSVFDIVFYALIISIVSFLAGLFSAFEVILSIYMEILK
jgi:hypothetical protein